MHTYIYGIISQLIKRNHSYTMLSKHQIPNDEDPLFLRGFWSYGDLTYYSNNVEFSSDMFIIEVYEKMFENDSEIEELVTSLRKEILSLRQFKYSNKVGRIEQISVTNNVNDPAWKSFTIIIPINIFEEEAE